MELGFELAIYMTLVVLTLCVGHSHAISQARSHTQRRLRTLV